MKIKITEQDADKSNWAIAPAGSSLAVRRCACGAAAGLSGQCAACAPAALAAAPALAPPAALVQVPYREEMEAAFSRSLGHLVVHIGEDATGGPSAATVGNALFFKDPAPPREVVAHEVAHAVQQSNSRSPFADRLTLEKEADIAAGLVMSGVKPVISLQAPVVLQRWEAGEHILIGDAGFLLGQMLFIAQKFKFALSTDEQADILRVFKFRPDDAVARFLSICEENGVSRFKAIPELKHWSQKFGASHAITYGEATALQGDLTEKPEELAQLSQMGLETALNLEEIREERRSVIRAATKVPYSSKVNLDPSDAMQKVQPEKYQGLPIISAQTAATFLSFTDYAKRNYAHFGIETLTMYVKYHQLALKYAALAKMSSNAQDEEVRRGEARYLELAFQYNTFADHFLSDAYCSGHIRTPRLAISELLLEKFRQQHASEFRRGEDLVAWIGLVAKFIHDIDNLRGVWVRCVGRPALGSWRAFGDKMLAASPRTTEVAGMAVAASVQELLAAANGAAPPTHDAFAALDFFPVLDASRHPEGNDNRSIAEILRDEPDIVDKAYAALPDYPALVRKPTIADVVFVTLHLDELYGGRSSELPTIMAMLRLPREMKQPGSKVVAVMDKFQASLEEDAAPRAQTVAPKGADRASTWGSHVIALLRPSLEQAHSDVFKKLRASVMNRYATRKDQDLFGMFYQLESKAMSLITARYFHSEKFVFDPGIFKNVDTPKILAALDKIPGSISAFVLPNLRDLPAMLESAWLQSQQNAAALMVQWLPSKQASDQENEHHRRVMETIRFFTYQDEQILARSIFLMLGGDLSKVSL